MIKKLLVVTVVAGAVSVICFAALRLMGGFQQGLFHHRSPWSPAWAATGPDVSRDLPWTGGERLDIGYPAEIVFTQGPQARFTVTGPMGLVNALRLDGGSLTGPDDFDFHFGRHHHGRLKIAITSPNTHEFHLSGANKLELVNFNQDSLALFCSGAADVRGQGHAKRLEAHISGAGHLELGELPVDDAVVSISGAGDASIDPKTSADISISGAGHVKLKTKPASLQTHISGFGSVEQP